MVFNVKAGYQGKVTINGVNLKNAKPVYIISYEFALTFVCNMKPICPHLFVYGTLLDNSNYYGAHLQQHCTLLQPGKFKGTLYDIGEYPGAIADADNGSYVHGSIYLMDAPEKILAFIDDYEGFGEDQEQPNLFVRELMIIEGAAGPVECWVYIYNLPVSELKKILSGVYAKKNKYNEQ